MKIKKFNEKIISLYHGYGGSPSYDRVECLEEIGFTNIISDYIDYDYEWEIDECKSLFQRELIRSKNSDVIVGFSLGGYLAFELAGVLSKDLILVNPAIDRSITRLDIKSFDIEAKSNFKKVEVFFGENDTLIDKNVTIRYLHRKRINFNYYIIDGMAHRTPIEDFVEIINTSNLL